MICAVDVRCIGVRFCGRYRKMIMNLSTLIQSRHDLERSLNCEINRIQIKLIFAWTKVLYLASLWKRGLRQLLNGLFISFFRELAVQVMTRVICRNLWMTLWNLFAGLNLKWRRKSIWKPTCGVTLELPSSGDLTKVLNLAAQLVYIHQTWDFARHLCSLSISRTYIRKSHLCVEIVWF